MVALLSSALCNCLAACARLQYFALCMAVASLLACVFNWSCIVLILMPFHHSRHGSRSWVSSVSILQARHKNLDFVGKRVSPTSRCSGD